MKEQPEVIKIQNDSILNPETSVIVPLKHALAESEGQSENNDSKGPNSNESNQEQDDENDVFWFDNITLSLMNIETRVDLEENFIDQTWISFVELCHFINEHVAAIEIERCKDGSTDKPSHPMNRTSEEKSVMAAQRVRLIFKEESSKARHELIPKLVTIIKRLVLREVFIGMTKSSVMKASKNSATSADTDDDASILIFSS